MRTIGLKVKVATPVKEQPPKETPVKKETTKKNK